jgi:cysteine desulfurase
MRPETKIVSCMWANNEIGVIQPIEKIGLMCRQHNVMFHTDAVQAAGMLSVNLSSVDMLSLSAHKLHGPKGIGALYVSRTMEPQPLPLIHGGGQERGLRSGTLPVHQIVGFGVACELARRSPAAESVRPLRDSLLKLLRAHVPELVVNGSLAMRLPNNLNVSFVGVDNEALMSNARGVEFSTGSACTSATIEPSHVIRAIADDARARSAIRLGLSRYTTKNEVHEAARIIGEAVQTLREFQDLG